ncbi:ankyrin repeat protein [Histomonas meleagridis]|uniref:ankyrin repeat protein n=1 Tax=Histomonas meleagridis TaxID=135588 RepID=UPI00355A4744|nr:ankyrin repeat protein [Histomonas meleagridis]KAH0796348.1 ankyrin repeat protein [Histomonas meleagridis]
MESKAFPTTEGIEINTLADVEKTKEWEQFKDIITLIESLYNVGLNDEETQKTIITNFINYFSAHKEELPHLIQILINYVDLRPLHRKFCTQLIREIFKVLPEAVTLADQVLAAEDNLLYILSQEKLIPDEKEGRYDSSLKELVYQIYPQDTVHYSILLDDPTNQIFKILPPNARIKVGPLKPSYNVCNEESVSLICLAAFHGSIKCFNYLLQKGAKMTEELPLYACAGGHEGIVVFLAQNGVPFSHSCLIVAAHFHRYNILQFLFDNLPEKIMLLNIPLKYQNYRTFFFLLLKGVPVIKAVEDESFTTILHDAAQYCSPQFVKYIMNLDYISASEPTFGKKFTPLFTAIMGGQLESIRYLVEEKNSDVNAQCESHDTPVWWSTMYGTLEIVKYFVEQQNYEFIQILESITPLMCAVNYSKTEISKYLIEKLHMDPNAENPVGLNSLHIACKSGSLKIVKYLLENKLVDKEKKSGENMTPLWIAAITDHVEVLQYLHQEQHCDPFCTDANHNIPPVLASISGNMEILAYYIDNKVVDINYQNEIAGYTFLHFAAQKPELYDMVKYLLDHGANPNIVGKDGNTPLHVAVMKNEEDIDNVEILVESGADTEILSDEGFTPLHVAYILGRIDSFIYLVKHGANINAKMGDGETMFENACKDQNIDTIKFLIKYDSIDTEIGSNGITPFLAAVIRGDIIVVKYLCEKTKCNKHATTPDGYSPLFNAIKNKQFQIVDYLLQVQHFDKNERDPKTGLTLLHEAAMAQSLQIVQYLVEQEHLDVNALSNEGTTPLYYASFMGAKDIVEYLLQNKATTHLKNHDLQPIDVVCHSKTADKSVAKDIENLLSKYKEAS